MRIQDKYKTKSKPSSPAAGSGNGGGGEANTNTTEPTVVTTTTNIHACIESGDLVELRRFLSHNPSSLNERNNLLIQTPLHIAASLNRIDMMKCLLDWEGSEKAELEAKNIYGEAPLHEAAKNGCNHAAVMLLQYGADVEARTNNSMTPLHLAVGYALRSGNNSVVKTLSEYNADFSAEDDSFGGQEGMIPFNYLPAGVENDELQRLCQQLGQGQQINSADSGIEGMFPFNYLQAGVKNDELQQLFQQLGLGQQINNANSGIEGMFPFNYLQAGVKNDELLQLYQQIGLGQQINTADSGIEGMFPFNYLQAGVNNDELLQLFQQIGLGQQINTAGSGIEGMFPFNFLPAGVKNDEPQHVCQQLGQGQQISNSDSGIEGMMNEFNNELSKIVGLHDLKLQLQKWAKGIILDEKRRAMGIDLGSRKPPHMAFLGNPGTGKTTVARILGKLLCSVGVLSSDTVTEVQRTDLVGEFLGQTGPKTRKKIEEAMGGILFVDEAYRLVPDMSAGNSIEYGVEALEEIMSVLEDGDLLVIFAGYTEPMKRVFSSNEGFCRRVTHFFQFDDFSCKDLAEMLLIKMNKQNEKSRFFGFKLHPSCSFEAVLSVIERNSSEKMRNKMNGGLVDHMLSNARENLDSRLNFNSEGDELMTITLGDLDAGLQLLARRLNLDEEEKKSVDKGEKSKFDSERRKGVKLLQVSSKNTVN